jgi:3-oxoacyl-[acyl-carrier protein] reductase
MLQSGTVAVLWDIDATALDKGAAALKRDGRVDGATVDVTDEAAIARGVETAIRDFDRIDILVNNAGITGGNAPLWELKPTSGGASSRSI